MRRIRNDAINTKLQVDIQPNIGLDGDLRPLVVDLLNITLADESVLTIKTRCAYWNVSGTGFFELHAVFGTQYGQLNCISGEIAERARMLGGFAIGNLQEFLNLTRLDEQPGEVPDVLRLLADHEAVIRFLRGDAEKSIEEYEDEGTFDLLVSIMRQHEKIAWMLRSYIDSEQASSASRGTW